MLNIQLVTGAWCRKNVNLVAILSLCSNILANFYQDVKDSFVKACINKSQSIMQDGQLLIYDDLLISWNKYY